MPDHDAIRKVLGACLAAFLPSRIAWPKVVEVASGLSQADLARAANEVIKGSILRGEKIVSTEELLAALRDRRAMRETVLGMMDS